MATERMSAIVGARITEFRRKMAEVNATMRKTATNVVVNVVARTDKAQDRLDRIAKTINTLDTIARNTGQGLSMMASPALVPILASLVGVIGALGPMIGTVGGSAFALATAFGFAGTAAVAFGAAAIPSITKLFDETQKLTGAQAKARGEYDKFKSTWQGITKDLEKPVLQSFSKAMQIANKALQMARPLFDSAAIAVNNLLSSLSTSIDSAPVRAFFDYMNTSAGPILETLGKAGGNFVQGFMSMMTAFGPLAEKTAQGFLSMSNGFATWAAGLSKSEKFQSFVNYITENMPKIKSIFGDAISGIIDLFAAFGPSSSDLMTSVQNLMGRFKEWAATLKDNQAFQSFISYIQTNGPVVASTIGEIAKFIVNFGTALAPLGAKILGMVQSFLSWTNSMMSAHPAIGKIVAILVVVTGALIALAPNIIAAVTLFSGFGSGIASVFAKLAPAVLPILKTITSSFVRLGAQALIQGARIAAGWILAMGPIGWIIVAVVALVALIIANWDTVKAWTIKAWTATINFLKAVWEGIKTAAVAVWDGIKAYFAFVLNTYKTIFTTVWDAIKSFLSSAWEGIKTVATKVFNALKSFFVSIWDGIKAVFNTVITAVVDFVKQRWENLKNNTSNVFNAVKSAISTIWNGIKSFFSTILNTIVDFVKQRWENLKNNTSTVFNAVKSTISSIWNGIKSFLSGLIEGIKNSVRDKFESMKNAVKEKMELAKQTIENIWGNIKSFFEGINLYDSGKKIIQSVIDGIGAMKDKVTQKVGEIAGAIRDFFPFSPAKEGPLSTLHRLDFAGPVIDSIARARSPIQAAMRQMLTMPSADFGLNPAIAGATLAGGAIEHMMKPTTPSRYDSKSKDSRSGMDVTNNFYSPKALTPSETARKNLEVSRRLAMEWGV